MASQRRLVAALGVILPIATGLLLNLVAAAVPSGWIQAWRWPLTILLAFVLVASVVRVLREDRQERAADLARESSYRTVSAASDRSGVLEVVAVTQSGSAHHADYRENGSWSDWTDLKFPGQAWDVAVTCPMHGRLECYVVDLDGKIWYRGRDRSGWSGWERVGRSYQSGRVIAIAAMSGWPGHRELFAVDETGGLTHSWRWEGEAWSDWSSTEKNDCRDVALAVPVDGLLQSFVVDRNGSLWHRWFEIESLEWTKWADMGIAEDASAGVAVGAFSGQDGHQEVVVVGTKGGLAHRYWHLGKPWSEWARMPTATNVVDVCGASSSSGSWMCVVVDTDGHLWRRLFTRGQWSGWEALRISDAESRS